MNTPRNSSELRAAAAARGFNSSPLIEEMLSSLEAAEGRGGDAAALLPRVRMLRRATTILAVTTAVLAGVAGFSFVRLQTQEAANGELASQFAEQRRLTAEHQKVVSDTVADLKRTTQATTESQRDATAAFTKQLNQLMDDNARLKVEGEKLRSELEVARKVAAAGALPLKS